MFLLPDKNAMGFMYGICSGVQSFVNLNPQIQNMETWRIFLLHRVEYEPFDTSNNFLKLPKIQGEVFNLYPPVFSK